MFFDESNNGKPTRHFLTNKNQCDYIELKLAHKRKTMVQSKKKFMDCNEQKLIMANVDLQANSKNITLTERCR